MVISASVIEPPQAVEVNDGLPVGWEQQHLGNFADIRRGASPRPIASPRWFSEDSSIGWVRISDIKVGTKYLDVTRQKLSPDGVLRSRFLAPGHLIMSIAATVGRPTITRIPACIHDGFIAYMNLHDIEIDYLYYLILHIEPELAIAGQTGSQSNINTQIVRDLLISVPPKPEQRAIAETLSDIDELIDSLDHLIAKKQAIKHATMQQLLTGKIRLPGFIDEWTQTTLGQICEIVSGGTPSSAVSSFWNGGIPWCTPSDITAEEGKYLKRTERTISHEGLMASSARLLPTGTLLLCSRATVGEVKLAQFPIATNQGFKSLVCGGGVSTDFLYYKTKTLKPSLIEKGVGSTFLEVSKRDVASIGLGLPVLKEQQAIAQILSDMDAEIDALKQRRAKTKAIKQGMMQGLLTGRTRLVTPGGARGAMSASASVRRRTAWCGSSAMSWDTSISATGRIVPTTATSRRTFFVSGYQLKVSAPS